MKAWSLVVIGILVALFLWWFGRDTRTTQTLDALTEDESGSLLELEGAPASDDSDRAAASLPLVGGEPEVGSPPEVAGTQDRPVPSMGIYGRVTAPDGSPLPGCIVSRAYASTGSRIGSSIARTDLDGNYSLEHWFSLSPRTAELRDSGLREKLERRLNELRSSGSEKARARFVNRDWPFWREQADAPGYLAVLAIDPVGRKAIRIVPEEDIRGRRVRVDLVIDPRPTLGGTVDGEEGAQADVKLFDNSWELLGTTSADEQGKYAFRVPDPGGYYIHARKSGRGSGAASGFLFAGDFQGADVNIVLGGGGTLRGRVLFSDGAPVQGIGIIAAHTDLDALTPGNAAWPPPAALAQAEAAGGLAWAKETTDAEGRFEMNAMSPGEFALLFDGMGGSSQPSGTFSATGAEHELVFEGHLLLVTVDGPPDLLLRTRLRCVDVTPEHIAEERLRRQPLRWVGPLRTPVIFTVEPDTTWQVICVNEGRVGPIETVHIGSRDSQVKVEIDLDESDFEGDATASDLPRPESHGSLEVDLRDAKGGRVTALVSLWRREGTGRELLFRRLPCDADSSLPTLLPGIHDFRIDGTRSGGEFLLPIVGSKPLVIEAGKAELLRPTPQVGGCLELGIGKLTKTSGRTEHQVTAILVPADDTHGKITLAFQSGADQPPFETLTPGQRARCSEPLPPGQYELRLISETLVSKTVPVRIAQDEVTTVEVSLGLR